MAVRTFGGGKTGVSPAKAQLARHPDSQSYKELANGYLAPAAPSLCCLLRSTLSLVRWHLRSVRDSSSWDKSLPCKGPLTCFVGRPWEL